MSEELVTISVRVRRDQADEIDALAEERGVDRSAKMRELLAIALNEARLRNALDQLREGKITVMRAARLAGVTYRGMLVAMREHNVPFPLTEEELRREIDETLRHE
jgi:predicted HTH domain antitoxin